MRGKIFFLTMLVIVPFLAPGFAPGESSTLEAQEQDSLRVMQIEDYASRDRIRLNTMIGVVYGTSEAQMTRILTDIETFLKNHPQIWPDTVVVRFTGFGASSLDIEVMCWFQTTDFNTFRDCRQETLLAIMRIVEEAGSSFAFPTQTLHLVKEDCTPPESS